MKSIHGLHGFHCRRFDTALLAQVIAMDVDNAIHRLWREQGVVIDAATGRAWVEMVLKDIEATLMSDCVRHALLPAVLLERIQVSVRRLVEERTA